MSAPYTGGFSPGSEQFAVDGDFTQFEPCSPPKISYPMRGDSVFSDLDILYLDYSQNPPQYIRVPLGTFPNLQPWSSNQRTIVIEQDFMVAMEAYYPLPLNTPYDNFWSIGWTGQLSNGQPTESLSEAILVEIGDLEDMGQGIIKVKLRFATLPPTRNEIEQFCYNFVGLSNGRQNFNANVNSRLQYDYFVFDDFDILDSLLFPLGARLNSTTGLYPIDLILQPQKYYAPVADAVANAIFLPSDAALSDSPNGGVTPGSLPTSSDYVGWYKADPPELIAEGSTMRRWLGNIFERRTRFVILS